MNIELAKAIRDVCIQSGYEAELHEEYSGRCMYGETTCGVDVESVEAVLYCVLKNLKIFKELLEDSGVSFMDGIRSDNMGLGMILY